MFDVGHAEVAAEIENGQAKVGAVASAWSPSVSLDLFGINIELGVEVGSVGAYVTAGSSGFSGTFAALLGFSIEVEW